MSPRNTAAATAQPARQPPAGPRAEAKRRAIVKAARALFLREGFDASVDAIAAEAGVSKVTVYNHFGSKEALFIGVVKDSLDAPLDDTLAAAIEGLGDSDDLRKAMVAAARAWVADVRADPDVLALRNVVARELHRFPELGAAWHRRGTEQHHPSMARALRHLADEGRLEIADLDVAILQLYSLLVYPHLVFSAYGAEVDDGLTDRLITDGVEMFLGHYGARADRSTEPA
ncbi:TetR/AcrR family transcriptional regulator [Streptomyces sp. NPDC059690]|uniref:TetR/AcrR family transcriptional regulator n=1 Tax=Streptomyces sp. NPDC059690 TaxID=3346907 RepID=UPI00367B8A05